MNDTSSNEPMQKSRIRKAIKKAKKRNANGKWEPGEQERFEQGIDKYGNSWKDVAAYVGTRNSNQCCSHAQKYFMRIKKEAIEKLKRDPKTKNNTFAIIKYYYNTALTQRQRILSYQANNIVNRFVKEEKNEHEEEEEVEEVSEEEEKSEEGLVERENSESYKKQINQESILRDAQVTEEEQVRAQEPDIRFIYHPCISYTAPYYGGPFIYPAHYTPFNPRPQNY